MIDELLESVKGAAQSFTYSGKILSFANPNFPLAVFADGYIAPINGDNEPLNNKKMVSVEEHFEQINQTETEITKDERETIIENTHVGVAQLQYNVHNVMIPAIKAMCQSYSEIYNEQTQADIAVDVFCFNELHSNQEFNNHVFENYSNMVLASNYRTFILQPMSTEEIIDFVAQNNNHFPRELLTEWALTLGSQRISVVWDSLFGKDRQLQLKDIPFLRLGTFPFNIDDVLFAYFILAAFRDNPQNNVVSESVSLEEWTSVFSQLHAAFGKVLLGLYERRVQLRDNQELVLKYDSDKAIEKRMVRVVLNGDLVEEWQQNNTVEILLGAAVYNRALRTIPQIDSVKEDLIKAWNKTYPLIKQAALDNATVNRKKSVTKAFMDNIDTITSLVEPGDVKGLLNQAMAKCSLSDYDNHFILFTKLVCEVSGSDYIYQEYLNAIDEFSRMFPNATAGELETQALITVIALYMARQITVVNYTPDIVPDVADEDESVEEPVETPEDEVEESDTDVTDTEEESSEEPTEASEDDSESEVESEEQNEMSSAMDELDEMDEESKE